MWGLMHNKRDFMSMGKSCIVRKEEHGEFPKQLLKIA
jgi:hypothetical protein